MKSYIRELRQNRDFKATEFFKNSLFKTGVEIKDLQKRFLSDIALLQNRTRGPLFKLMAEVMIGNVFNVSEFDRQAVFTTPDGVRRFDLFVPSQGIAFEVKSGYVRLRSFTSEQINKDRYLLENDERVKRVIWVCFRGATAPLERTLKGKEHEPEIEYFDIGYDQMEVDEEKPKQVIRV